MKSLFKKILINITITFLLFSQTLACTAVTLSNKKGDVVSGRTMEWGFNWNWKVIYVPKDTENFSTAPSNLDLPKQSYSSKYSIIGTGLIHDGQKFFVDGQNSQGLSISANYLPGFTKYQKLIKVIKNMRL